jgi:hypothetical protein
MLDFDLEPKYPIQECGFGSEGLDKTLKLVVLATRSDIVEPCQGPYEIQEVLSSRSNPVVERMMSRKTRYLLLIIIRKMTGHEDKQ